MRTARAVLDTEVQYVESHLCKGRGSRSTGKTRSYNNNVQTALVSRVHQFLMVLVIGPFELQRSLRDLGVLRSDNFSLFLRRSSHYLSRSFGCFAGFLCCITCSSYRFFHFSTLSNFLSAGLNLCRHFFCFLRNSLCYLNCFLFGNLNSFLHLRIVSYLLYFFFYYFGCFLCSIQNLFFLCHNSEFLIFNS